MNHSLSIMQKTIFRTWWIIVLAGCGSQAVQVPTSFSPYNAKDGTFACEYPEDWEAKGGGGRGPVWAKFASGPALIEVKASPAGSLLSDAMGGGGSDENTPPQFEPVHLVHTAYQGDAEKEFDDYTEIAGSPIVMNCSLGPARLSEFTSTTTFGTAMHGYRATIIGRDKGVQIFCTCPEADWTAVKPAFAQTLASFIRGETE